MVELIGLNMQLMKFHFGKLEAGVSSSISKEASERELPAQASSYREKYPDWSLQTLSRGANTLELLWFLHRPAVAERNLLTRVLNFLKLGYRETVPEVPAVFPPST